jgi:hypothetical protein
MSLPDTAEYWSDVRDFFRNKGFQYKRRFDKTPANVLLNEKVIHRGSTTYEARNWLRRKIKDEHKNPPGEGKSWISRAAELGYTIRSGQDTDGELVKP